MSKHCSKAVVCCDCPLLVATQIPRATAVPSLDEVLKFGFP